MGYLDEGLRLVDTVTAVADGGTVLRRGNAYDLGAQHGSTTLASDIAAGNTRHWVYMRSESAFTSTVGGFMQGLFALVAHPLDTAGSAQGSAGRIIGQSEMIAGATVAGVTPIRLEPAAAGEEFAFAINPIALDVDFPRFISIVQIMTSAGGIGILTGTFSAWIVTTLPSSLRMRRDAPSAIPAN